MLIYMHVILVSHAIHSDTRIDNVSVVPCVVNLVKALFSTVDLELEDDGNCDVRCS